jgi:hypothetical protein
VIAAPAKILKSLADPRSTEVALVLVELEQAREPVGTTAVAGVANVNVATTATITMGVNLMRYRSMVFRLLPWLTINLY